MLHTLPENISLTDRYCDELLLNLQTLLVQCIEGDGFDEAERIVSFVGRPPQQLPSICIEIALSIWDQACKAIKAGKPRRAESYSTSARFRETSFLEGCFDDLYL